jgi:hypothetical protein
LACCFHLSLFRFLRSSSPTDRITGLCVENNVDMKRGSLHLSCIQTGGRNKPDDRKYLTALLSRLATNLLYDD